MTIKLPEIAIDYESSDPNGLTDAVDVAICTIDRHVLLANKLFESRSEDFYSIAQQVHQQMRDLLRHANQVEDDFYRKDFRRRLYRVQAVIDFLQQYGPYVPGSGGQRPARPKGKVESMRPGGLPGLGKRR